MEIDLKGLVLPERVEAAEVSEDGRSARFVIEPLERGFGHTLGNSVRRVLLSSLRGSAVWAFRIDGVVHEHQTIPGVVEDVHQVIQNLKYLVVKLDEDPAKAAAAGGEDAKGKGGEAKDEASADGEPDGGEKKDGERKGGEEKDGEEKVDDVVLRLTVGEPGPVTAGRISPHPRATVLDPDHHLFTLQEKRKLHMELRVNEGRGFVLADQHRLPKGSPVDLVRIDAIYNPVRRANFTVEETRVGQRTDFDRLTLFVETDGSVDPKAAVGYAAELVRKHLSYLLHFGEGLMPGLGVPGRILVPERLRELITRAIDDVAELTVRSRNSLQKENINTLRDLIQRTEQEMLEIDNFGKKSLMEMAEFLESHGLRFGMALEEGEGGRLFFVEDEETEIVLGGEEGDDSDAAS